MGLLKEDRKKGYIVRTLHIIYQMVILLLIIITLTLPKSFLAYSSSNPVSSDMLETKWRMLQFW